MEAGLKKCPHCAEEVQKAAKVCKHCGKKFGAGFLKTAAIGFALLLGGCGTLAFIGSKLPDKTTSATADSTQATSEPAPTALKIGDTFQVDDLEYKISKPSYKKKIGSNQFASKKAESGASYVIANYSVLNKSKETATVLSDNFQLTSSDRAKYHPDSEALTALAMSGDKNDFILSELQPGIRKSGVTVFQVPDAATKNTLTLQVPSNQAFSGHSAEVLLK